jgi:acyl-CoA synthetase (AMP-forming)/AMP-acid ligase II
LGGEYSSLYTGSKLNFVENPETIPENVREIAPTVFTAVPRVWEKFYSGVMITLKEAGFVQQAVYAWGIGVGGRIADKVLAGQAVGWALKAQFVLAQWLALNNVRKLIGIHRARYLVTGAAPISPELVRWYLALGVPMLEVWGMTETCGAATGVPAERMRPGSIGPAAGYNEVRLDPATGEILVRGENVFAGYLNLPEKTRRVRRQSFDDLINQAVSAWVDFSDPDAVACFKLPLLCRAGIDINCQCFRINLGATTLDRLQEGGRERVLHNLGQPFVPRRINRAHQVFADCPQGSDDIVSC